MRITWVKNKSHCLLRMATLAGLVAMALTGCGGGTSNVRPTPQPPPTNPRDVNPCTQHASSPACQPIPDYSSQRIHLDPTHVTEAQSDGFTGKGVKIGIIGTGADRDNPALNGRVASYKIYASANEANPDVDDANGHGTVVAEIAAGRAADYSYGSQSFHFPGGVAPQASLYVAREATDKNIFPFVNLPAAYNGLLSQGVLLINSSWGQAAPITDKAKGNPDVIGTPSWEAALFQPIIQAGGLMVFSAMNNGRDEPSVQAGLPRLFPNLQKGWLAVVNVDIDSKGRVSGLHSGYEPSNACGVAAKWCLAAPGVVTVVPPGTIDFPGNRAVGTSFSAPIVTGTAALVWQAYPWMDGNNVQETLLGTASPLGDPKLYGYGLVNAEKAVHGPALLDWGVFDADVTGASTFSNDMHGSGGLTLSGTGTLHLSGTDTYTGGTTVHGGTLLVDGSIKGAVTVGNDGTLGGQGTVHAGSDGVTSSGTVTTGDGALTIDGNYTVNSADATTAIEIGSPLTVTGKTSVQGILNLLAPPSNYTVKATETLLTTGKGLSGTFGKTTYEPSLFYTAKLAYGSKNLTATMTRTNVATTMAAQLPHADARVHQSAEHVEQALEQADTWAANSTTRAAHGTFLAAANTFLNTRDRQLAALSLQSLSGQILASSQAEAMRQTEVGNQAIMGRLDAVHLSASSTGLWTRETGAGGDLGQSGFAAGRYVGSRRMLGLDIGRHGGLVAGLAFARTRRNGQYAGLAGRVRTRSNTMSLYARLALGHHAYLSGRMAHVALDTRSMRRILLAPALLAVGQDRHDRMNTAYVEIGRAWCDGKLRLTPFVAMDADALQRAAIHERGGAGFGLVAPPRTYRQWATSLGLRAARHWHWAAGETSVRGYVLWRHMLRGTDPAFMASFAGVPGQPFRVEGIGPARNQLWTGVRMDTRLGRHWIWHMNAAINRTGHANNGSELDAAVSFSF